MKKPVNLFAFIFLVLLLSCSRQPERPVIGLNEVIRHDDFDYSVAGFSVSQRIGNDTLNFKAKGNFYIVTFYVTNNAKRVNHPWDNSVAYVVDDAGNEYNNNADIQRLLNEVTPFGWKENYVTAFQSQDSTIMVFDVPINVKKPYLMVRGQTLMGDFLNGNQFEKTKVKLF